MASTSMDNEQLERAVQSLARRLFHKAAEHKPALFNSQDLLGRMIDWSLDDESVRVALFRFVDVLPSLETSSEIGRHLEEYFGRVDNSLAGVVYLAQVLHAGTWVAPVVRRNIVSLARRFIAEETGDHLSDVLTALRQEPAAFTLDVVGEATVSDREADAMQQRYLGLLRRLTSVSQAWPAVGQIDDSPRGPIPRVNLSVKLSSLCARFDPLDPSTEMIVRERLRELFREAARLGASITVDMEQNSFRELTLALFCGVLQDPEFEHAPAAAIALQAYLIDGERDVRRVIDWARRHDRRVGVRLVKGAYWDSEIAWAKQKNWPVPVFVEKSETDANYERLTQLLLENHDVVDAAFGSHNLRSLAHAIVVAKQLDMPVESYEIQMLYGMAEPIRRAIIQNGQRVRVYLPVGELLPGISYLIRRLMENTSNTSFLRQTYAEKKDVNSLVKLSPVRPPVEIDSAPVKNESLQRVPFSNVPLIDFSFADHRNRFADHLNEVRGQINAQRHQRGTAWLESVNPARPTEVIGRVRVADEKQVEKAIDAAVRYAPEWRETAAKERAEILFKAARIMTDRRWELAAAEVFEVGKGWREADADVAEAVDYLNYYAEEMLRLADPRLTQDLPSETNQLLYQPRGVAAVIAPWNFPLAILAGMTAAALVTGNGVLMKPAEQSPFMAERLREILDAAGLPSRACQLLHGGGEVGAQLVGSPQVHIIAFTGSREVGLEILQRAHTVQSGQQHVKRVVCEMGGKNAVIVDNDADLDEAIVHVVDSAFGFQGQKCSAASRLIVCKEIYQRFIDRLVEAVASLKIGAPEDPRNFIGPVIDAEAQARIRSYIKLGKQEGRCTLEMPAPGDGYFVGPVIFADVDPQARIAREEIFGPVLSVIRAKDMDHALAIANDSMFGLTGGIFSRSPAHIEKARKELRVGNLYINRGITGAVVERQPFGGLKLSGSGFKVGGPDYLLQFLDARTVSENTQRHGFIPAEPPKK